MLIGIQSTLQLHLLLGTRLQTDSLYFQALPSRDVLISTTEVAVAKERFADRRSVPDIE